jgi:deoxyribodipyrimidine photo-lyase
MSGHGHHLGGQAVTGGVQIVWFKRDLRVSDHRPLRLASERGPVLPLLVVEPELWRQPDASARQWAFAAECAEELRAALAALGQPLVVRCGDVVEVLERARRYVGVAGLWSHEETGNGWTYARDRRVAAWARGHGIPWHELPQFGVVRRLVSRDGWARRWEEQMGEPLTPPPLALQPLTGLDPGPLPSAAELDLAADPCPLRQRGGRSRGLALLESFLAERGHAYQRELSSPNTAFRSCSRLSPHLTWGSLSLREVVRAGRAAQAMPRRSRRAFDERLHWHCHFIQKLESQPDLEFRELHPLTSGLRDGEADWFTVSQAERLAAWSEGRTGLPLVDACMRALAATGWLNFRMRAMVMAVASYHLWLPWRASGLVLARRFVDYEPGIHWSQCQMQSGTTGINTVRIYNPIKQGLDHDPEGVFIRRWLPELAPLPAVFLHQPWLLDPEQQQQLGWQLGRDYPQPIVEPEEAARQARERIYARRQELGFSAMADAIQQRHGSRRAGLPATGSGPRRRRRDAGVPGQLQLDLGC